MAHSYEISAVRLWAAELGQNSQISDDDISSLIDTIRPSFQDGWLLRAAIEVCEVLASWNADRAPGTALAKRERVAYLRQQPGFSPPAPPAVVTALRYAAARLADRAFTAADFLGPLGVSTDSDRITPPAAGGDYYLAFAVRDLNPELDDLTGAYETETAPQFNQLAAFQRLPGIVALGGLSYEVHVSTHAFLASTAGLSWRLEEVGE